MDDQPRQHAEYDSADNQESGSRSRREYRITGLADLLPDWLLPPEGKQHIRNARKEMLLAARSVLDAAIDRQERGTVVRRTPSRIEIE